MSSINNVLVYTLKCNFSKARLIRVSAPLAVLSDFTFYTTTTYFTSSPVTVVVFLFHSVMNTPRILCRHSVHLGQLCNVAPKSRPCGQQPWIRCFSETGNSTGSDGSTSSTTAVEWRKVQLDRLENKFNDEQKPVVQNEEDLQPMWKEMESRVTRRKPRTVAEMGGKTGRRNVRKTDEEMWLQEGLYDKNS